VNVLLAGKMLSRSRNNSILRRRSAAHSSGNEKFNEYLFNKVFVYVKGDAQLPSDTSPLTHQMGIDQ
jgi:hypothetical protein